MSFNPSDNRFAIIAEATAGTTPATPAFITFEHEESNNVNYTAEWIDSPNVKPNRGSAGGRNVSFSTTGSLSSHVFRDPAIDLLLESGLSGSFTADVLKGGAADKSLTIEKRMGVSGGYRYHRVSGSQVSKTSFSGKASENCMIAFDTVGMAFDNDGAIITGATYADPASTTRLAGPDVTVSIAGLTVDHLSYSVDVEFARSAQFKFGSTAARGIGTSGVRKVSGEIEFFMPASDYFATLADPDGLALTITMGSGANGYELLIPRAQFQIPEDANDGSAIIVKAGFMGADDDALGTNIQITRLA